MASKRKKYPLYNRCRLCGSVIALGSETNKLRARQRRFFNPSCNECFPVSDWKKIQVVEESSQLFNHPHEARKLVTQLQDQDIPAVMDHLGEGEYLVTRYKKSEHVCPEEFKEGCIIDGAVCPFYKDGVCEKVETLEASL
jgi:hypothetical protein